MSKENKGLVPERRFPEFKNVREWKMINLGIIGKVSMCKRILKDKTSTEGDIPFYKIGTFGKQADAYVGRDIFEVYKDKYSYPKKGEILISASGTIGRLVVFDGEDAYFQDSNIVWIENNEAIVVNGFLFYCYQKIKWIIDGNTIARLYNDNLQSMKTFICSITEQQKIADCLSSIDEIITAHTKKHKVLQSYKKGLMQKLFSQEIRFKDEHGNDYPNWVDSKLGEIVIKSSSNISANTIEENVGSYKIYGASGLFKEIDFYREEMPYISIVKDGAGVGRTLLCEGYSSILATLEIIKPKSEINLYFVYCLLNNINFLKYITGSTIPHIYFKDYSNEKIKTPHLGEQTKIANCLSALDDKINLVDTQITKVTEFKKGLMQQLFPAVNEVVT